MSTKSMNRREALQKARGEREKLTDEVVELPAFARTQGAKTISEQIQEQIAIQIAKKQVGDDQQSPEEILAELNDLDVDVDSDPPWTSQYEVQELPDRYEEEPFQVPEGAPLKESVPEQNNSSLSERDGDSSPGEPATAAS